MAIANGKRISSGGIKCPIEVFTKFQGGKMLRWNKESKENEVHDFSRFTILDIGYTVKGDLWDDNIRKYTSTFYSNEIKDWGETLYLVEGVYINGSMQKKLLAKGNWKMDVKPNKPQSAQLNLAVTVLDLLDGLVKSFYLSGGNFFRNNNTVQDIEGGQIFELDLRTKYTNRIRDNNGDEILISEEDLSKLSAVEARKYDVRYIAEIIKIDEKVDDEISDRLGLLGDEIDTYFSDMKKRYAKEFGEGEVRVYAKIDNLDSQEQELNKEIKENKEIEVKKVEVKKEEISIEDIPF